MINHANRGMALEELIEYANAWYLRNEIALIQKIPTDWKVIRSFRNGKSQIISAYPVRKATVDFIGLYHSRSIAFDAKSTENKTRLPLSNIEQHQQEFLRQWRKLGGIAFYLIEFVSYRQIFILTQKDLDIFQDEQQRKSIPYSYFVDHCEQVKSSGTNPLHYLNPYDRGVYE
jgi:recombination protein U